MFLPISTKTKTGFQPTRATLTRKSKNLVGWAFFFHLCTEKFGGKVKKNIKIHTRKDAPSLLQVDFLLSILIIFHAIDNQTNHLLDDFPSLLSGRLLPFKARRVLLLPLTTSGGIRYRLWWMMIINIDYDDDHGFDDGYNDVTSSPPSSTDHLWW